MGIPIPNESSGAILAADGILWPFSMKTFFAFAFFVLIMSAQAEDATLRAERTISLPGVSGRFDHFAIDLKSHRLFVAALGNDTVEIMDVSEGKHVHTISGLHKPQGIAFLSKKNQIVVAGGGDGSVRFFNGSTYALESTLSNLDDADNVRLDVTEENIYVGYGDGALAVIDSQSEKQIGEIKLAGHPESFQLEQQGDRIFVNVPDAQQISVVSRKSRFVVATWPMTYSANFPMTLDETDHRLFVGCRRPARLVALDTENGNSVADLEIAGDTDDLYYDATRKSIYAACGAGFIDIIGQENAGTYHVRQHLATSSGARTAFFSSELGRLFLAVPQQGKQIAEIRVYQIE